MSFLAAAGGDAGAPRAVERWPYRFFVYSAAATLALGVEITYTRIIGSFFKTTNEGFTMSKCQYIYI